MRYISLCSGIEAATLAWEPLGWEPVAFAEIDEFPSAVLSVRYPDVPNLGDFTKVDWSKYRGTVNLVAGGFPCFPADTLVLTGNGLVPIQEVKVGDMVLTHKGRYRKVLRTGSSISDTVILKGQGSAGIECTPNHPFYACMKGRIWNNSRRNYDWHLSDTSWVDASDMAGRMWLNVSAAHVESDIPTFRLKGEKSDFDFDESFFYFVGRWLGDGWGVSVKRKHRKDSVMKRVHVCCAHGVADELQERLDETGLHFVRSEEATTTKFVCVSASLYDWIIANFGKGAGKKHLPSWAFSMPIEYREALFLGYIDSDGTPVNSAVRTSSISKSLTVGMKILAAGIGYTSSVVRIKNARKECVIEGRTVNEQPYYAQTYYLHSRSAVLCYDGFWGRVRKVLPGRESVTVYNLEVEDDNSYTADGIAVHNCQSYSLAGNRGGLADPRGNLALEFFRAAKEIDPEWIVGENVPGLLSSAKGGDFQTILETVADFWPGGGVSWRVLDAEFTRVPIRDDSGEIVGWFGPVPQRRRRLFLVINTRDWRRAAAVHSQQSGMFGDPREGRTARSAIAADTQGGPRRSSAGGVAFAQNQRDEVRYVSGDGDVAGCVAATHRSDCKNETLLCVASNAANAEICQDVSPVLLARQYKDPPYIVDSGHDDVVCVVDDNANSAIDVNLAGTLKIGGGGTFVAMHRTDRTTSAHCARETTKASEANSSAKAR